MISAIENMAEKTFRPMLTYSDECHRSIYNVWSKVLTYFDAFIIGLTATPDKRTFAFFDENVVSEYPREQAIVDGVNVGEDIFLIETEITRNGARLMTFGVCIMIL